MLYYTVLYYTILYITTFRTIHIVGKPLTPNYKLSGVKNVLSVHLLQLLPYAHIMVTRL